MVEYDSWPSLVCGLRSIYPRIFIILSASLNTLTTRQTGKKIRPPLKPKKKKINLHFRYHINLHLNKLIRLLQYPFTGQNKKKNHGRSMTTSVWIIKPLTWPYTRVSFSNIYQTLAPPWWICHGENHTYLNPTNWAWAYLFSNTPPQFERRNRESSNWSNKLDKKKKH